MEKVSGVISLIRSKPNLVVFNAVLAVGPLRWKVERLSIQGCG